jgi:uncharacterized phiE125 gp8 family phage protein
MSQIPVLFNGPTAIPATINRVKSARRITSRSEDTLLETYLNVAIESVQEFTRRQLVAARYRLTLPGWPKGGFGEPQSTFGREDNAIELRRCPLIGVNSVKYYDSDGVQQTLATSGYDVFSTYEPALIKPSFGNIWPLARHREDSIQVEFTAGYMVPVSVNASTDTLTTDGIWQFTDGDEITMYSMDGMTDSTGISANTVYYVVGASGNDFQISTSSGGSAFNITGSAAYQLFAAVTPYPNLILQVVTMLAGHWYSHRCPPEACGCSGEGKAGIHEFQGLLNMIAWESALVNR